MGKPKFIVVTGCTRGLGRALALQLKKQGHTVAGCGRTAFESGPAGAIPPDHFEQVNVAEDSAVADWAGRLVARYGAPDLLVNNAGVIARNAPFWEISNAEFTAVLDVNLRGVANVLRHFLPPMLQRRAGIVVNLSSGWGRSASPEVAAYCATKWAIEGLTQSLSQELPHGMAAIALNPGIINTGMLRSCFGEAASHYPEPEAWAEAAGPFLLQLSARHNGESLTVPGIPVD